MKTWNAPEVQELSINETAGGFIKIGWEGPFGVIFGDGKEETTTPPTDLPETELPKDTVNPSGE